MTCWAGNKLIASSYSRNLFQNLIAVTQEVLTLRQQLSESQLTAAEKQKLMEKAAQLAAENVALKAQVDERSSMDYVAVLNEELVSVQKMLDDVTREKERELDDLRRRFGAVEREKELLQNSSSARQSEMMSTIASMEAKGEEQARKKEELLEELNKSQKKISELELREKDLQHSCNKVCWKHQYNSYSCTGCSRKYWIWVGLA